jgi:hypothetical protein
LWSEGLFSDWVAPKGYAARSTHTVYPICLPFFFTTTSSLFSLSFFIYTLSFILLFSPAPETKGAPTASSNLPLHTQALVLIGLSQENYILPSQWRKEIADEMKKKENARRTTSFLPFSFLLWATTSQYPQCVVLIEEGDETYYFTASASFQLEREISHYF